MLSRSFRPELEELASRILPSANPALSISDMSVLEGESGQVALVFTVSLSKASRHQVSVSYATADGIATAADNDYVPAAGRLTFAPGQTTKTITVLVNGDAKIEPNEWFTMNLSDASRAKIVDAVANGTIKNDDGTPADWWWVMPEQPYYGGDECSPDHPYYPNC